MQALAAEAATHASEPFYGSAEFWVAIAFILFIAATARTVFKVVTVALDDRADKIEAQINEASRLVEEAQELLATYQRKQEEAAEEARQMADLARREAERLAEQATVAVGQALRRREQLAVERIAQAEKAAIAEVRSRAIDVAMEATRRYLGEHVTGKKADALIDAAVGELAAKLRVH